MPRWPQLGCRNHFLGKLGVRRISGGRQPAGPWGTLGATTAPARLKEHSIPRIHARGLAAC